MPRQEDFSGLKNDQKSEIPNQKIIQYIGKAKYPIKQVNKMSI